MSVSESEPKNKLRWTILVCYSSNPNSFLIYTQSPDVDNEIISRGEIQPVHLSLTFRSKPRWWKTVSTVESIDQDANAEFTHSHCTQKPYISRSKWDFWPVEKREYLWKSTYLVNEKTDFTSVNPASKVSQKYQFVQIYFLSPSTWTPINSAYWQ